MTSGRPPRSWRASSVQRSASRSLRPVGTGNGVTLDFADSADFRGQRCAFLVGDEEFDGVLARLVAAKVAYHARPNGAGAGEIHHHNGGRGVYLTDPDGHVMEAMPASYSTDPAAGWRATPHRSVPD